MTQPIPEGHPIVTPYLIVPGVAALVDFLTEVFGAVEGPRLARPDGSVMHTHVTIGDSVVMMGEPSPDFGPMPASIYIYVEDCDATFAKAVEAGGTVVMPVTTMEHAGQRYGGIKDASGNIWWIATQVEDVSAEEEQRRIAAAE